MLQAFVKSKSYINFQEDKRTGDGLSKLEMLIPFLKLQCTSSTSSVKHNPQKEQNNAYLKQIGRFICIVFEHVSVCAHTIQIACAQTSGLSSFMLSNRRFQIINYFFSWKEL